MKPKTYLLRGVKLPCGLSVPWNRKTGCLTVNQNPLETCVDMPCFKSGICYALGGTYNPETGARGPRYHTCVPTWEENTRLFAERPYECARDLRALLNGDAGYVPQKFFRWNSAGELTRTQAKVMVWTAMFTPGTRHLVFTKRPQMLPAQIPENLRVIVSLWPDFNPDPKDFYRHACVVPTDHDLPRGVFECPGACETCRACWSLKDRRPIAFRAHGPRRKTFDRRYCR